MMKDSKYHYEKVDVTTSKKMPERMHIMSQYLLKEYYRLEREKEERDETKGGVFKLKGIIQKADTENGNNRVYPRPILEREMQNYQKLIKERRALGELNHSDSEEIDPKNVSHILTEAYWDGNDVIGTIEIFNTPNGLILQEFVKKNVNIGISSRGIGSLTNQNGRMIVEDNFKLICFDVVVDPSTPGAFLKPIQESIERKIFSKEDRINRLLNDILRSKK